MTSARSSTPPRAASDEAPPTRPAPVASSGRYELLAELGAGGMATVHLARIAGPRGFSRLVAVKRMHPQLAALPDYVAMFVDEARLTARIRHVNVVNALDLSWDEDGPSLVMDYVHGESIAALRRHGAASAEGLPPPVAVAIAIDVLRGLHAAHEARAEDGSPLGIVHRDVSPQNILVDESGTARLIDFGVARAAGHPRSPLAAEVRGKLAYMAPEQLLGEDVGPRADVFGLGVVLWEALAGARLFGGEGARPRGASSTREALAAPRIEDPAVPAALAAVVAKALSRSAEERYRTAADMAVALERATSPASRAAVASWLSTTAGELLAARRRFVEAAERGAGTWLAVGGRESERMPRSERTTMPSPRPGWGLGSLEPAGG